jgi:tRNA(Ile)-lysidine synthase
VLSPDYILHILTTECGYRPHDSILVGVSGGADSIALLHLLHSAKIPVAAAHVNYGLRGDESDGDEQFVSDLCAKLHVPFYLRRTNEAELNSVDNNLQNAARIVRYGFFKEIIEKESMRCIAVAHHQDDQLETVLMNFMRGSGLRGMTGMAMMDEVSVTIVRPLLNVSRRSIEEYLQQHQQTWRNDSSNFTDQYLRNRLRTEVIPGLHAIDERDSRGWKHSIEQLRNANALLYAFVSPYIDHIMTKHGMIGKVSKEKVLAFNHPRRLFNWILHYRGFQLQLTEEEFSDFVQQQPGKMYYSHGLKLVVDREHWLFHERSILTRNELALEPGLKNDEWTCEEIAPQSPQKYSGNEALVDLGTSDRKLLVRAWKAGDRIRPLGFDGTKKVSDVLTDMKVPSDEKSNYPVVTFQDDIVWIPGYRIAEKYKVTDKTKTALHIRWNR